MLPPVYRSFVSSGINSRRPWSASYTLRASEPARSRLESESASTESPKGALAAARLLWKIEKAYSLGIPKKNLALGESQTEEEHAYARRYTMFWPNGRSTGT